MLWNDPHGYDAYRAHCRWVKRDGPESVPDRTNRFGSFRHNLPEDLNQRVRERGWKLQELQPAVSQVVFHYDACEASRRCFEVLHDLRGLSTHFMVDLDGTVYQTLDLKERAWHAAFANDRSIGIEIAHIGAYEDMETLDRWYIQEGNVRRIHFPDGFGENGLPPNYAARLDVFEGTVNGKALKQYDFTEAQYQALEKLTVPSVVSSRAFARRHRYRRMAAASTSRCPASRSSALSRGCSVTTTSRRTRSIPGRRSTGIPSSERSAKRGSRF